MKLRELADSLRVTDDLWTNSQRAARAGARVKEFCGARSDDQADVQDFLADLRHYCDAVGLCYEDLDEMGATHHAAEVEEEGGPAKKIWEDE